MEFFAQERSTLSSDKPRRCAVSCVRPESRFSPAKDTTYEGTPAPQALDVDVAASREDKPFVAAFELQTEVPTTQGF